MSLDAHSAPNPDDLIQYGRDDAVIRLETLARQEAAGGDGRALRLLQRLVEAAGLRRRKATTTKPAEAGSEGQGD